ncbi:shikimate kinase [Breznakiella homolactica]|uniref:Shikimate kinase n=1 Tax=Breznakiella homolactica TaxID=2798577 RepID=A0A7T7XNP8_9SPIR|nr:shikimate kinase [Breznakiella homolactica]QQO09592.1 shikimate kinase [Breznakiella homolactica]
MGKKPTSVIIALTGPKHCGKTETGKALADLSGGTFLDLDTVAEELSGISPRELYKKGRDLFQEAETGAVSEVLRRASEDPGLYIIAAGGGIIDNRRAFETLKQSAVLVYLDIIEETAWKRIEAASSGGLPAFLEGAENPKQAHGELHRRRSGLYKNHAEITLSAENKDPAGISAEIWDIIKVRYL